MTIFQSIILGIVQGLTEFLPISSSAHLVFIPYLFNWKIQPAQAFAFDVLVQVATLIAVIVFFWSDLVRIAKAMVNGLYKGKPFTDPIARLGWLIILATIPAGLAGLLLKKSVEAAFGNARVTAIFMFVTAALLVLAELVGKRTRLLDHLNWKDAVWIGIFQAISIFPGISRSGATISGGMTRNLERPAAARFAFLMSIPIMLAAGALESFDVLRTPDLAGSWIVFIPGLIAAAITGYLVIRWLLRFLTGHTLYDFAIYCVAMGLIVLTLTYTRA